jgi:hypothetical protein
MTAVPQGALVVAPAAPGRVRLVKILAAVVAISGVVEVLSAALYIAGSHALVFLLAGFGDLGLALPLTELVVLLFGFATMGAAVGLWKLRRWGWALGLGVSLASILVGLIARNLTSFIFIRGVVVLVALVMIRDLFRSPLLPATSP